MTIPTFSPTLFNHLPDQVDPDHHHTTLERLEARLHDAEHALHLANEANKRKRAQILQLETKIRRLKSKLAAQLSSKKEKPKDPPGAETQHEHLASAVYKNGMTCTGTTGADKIPPFKIPTGNHDD
jgi:hypothetical protein